jgi:hypothetical protein
LIYIHKKPLEKLIRILFSVKGWFEVVTLLVVIRETLRKRQTLENVVDADEIQRQVQAEVNGI